MAVEPLLTTPAPVILMFPWLGSTQSAISKYNEVYEAILPNVVFIVKEVGVMDFLWPSSGLKTCKNFLLEIENKILTVDRPVIIHSMSIGCYFYSLMLLVLKSHPHQFHKIRRNLTAQVVDSPVIGTLHEMATGVSTSISSNRIVQRICKLLTLSYFSVTKFATTKIYDKVIDNLKYDPPYIPSLIFSSVNDPLAVPLAFNDFVDGWKRLPFDVVSKVFSDSAHAQHLLYHRETYCKLLNTLLFASLNQNQVSSKL